MCHLAVLTARPPGSDGHLESVDVVAVFVPVLVPHDPLFGGSISGIAS